MLELKPRMPAWAFAYVEAFAFLKNFRTPPFPSRRFEDRPDYVLFLGVLAGVLNEHERAEIERIKRQHKVDG